MYLTVNEFIMDIVMCFALICTMFIPIYIFKFVMKIYGYYIGHKISKELEKDNETQIVIIKERNRQMSKYIYRDQKINEFLKSMLNVSNIELSQIKIINYIQEYVELLDKKLKIK